MVFGFDTNSLFRNLAQVVVIVWHKSQHSLLDKPYRKWVLLIMLVINRCV